MLIWNLKNASFDSGGNEIRYVAILKVNVIILVLFVLRWIKNSTRQHVLDNWIQFGHPFPLRSYPYLFFIHLLTSLLFYIPEPLFFVSVSKWERRSKENVSSSMSIMYPQESPRLGFIWALFYIYEFASKSSNNAGTISQSW